MTKISAQAEVTQPEVTQPENPIPVDLGGLKIVM
jgi:hypothetical protein